MKATKLFFSLLLAGSLLTVSCKKDSTDTPTSHNYPVEFRMVDAPGPYEEVNIDVQGMEVNATNDNGSGWQTLNVRKGVYNLLKLTNGLDTFLASGTLPSGTISQIRLILGPNNSLKTGGKTYSLETPSAQQSGLKLQVHETLTEGITYIIYMDFDAQRSIVERGNGKYNLKPVIRTFTQATSGAIKGMAAPVASRPMVRAVMGTDTVTTVADTNSGAFLLRGLKAGSWNLYFDPAAPYASKTINGVGVTIGKVTDVGTVNF